MVASNFLVGRCNVQRKKRATQKRVDEDYFKFIWNSEVSSDTIYEYVIHLLKSKKSSTCWTYSSLLIAYFSEERKITVEKKMIHRLLKNADRTLSMKQAPAFEKDDVYKYLRESESTGSNLVKKLYILFSYFCALRSIEA